MVYRKRRTYRKRRVPKKLTKPQLRQVKSLLAKDVEHKYYGTYFSYTAISRAGSLSRLDMPPQGNAYNNRVGDEIKLTSLEFRFNAYLESTSTVTHALRLIIFRWNLSTNLATPTLASILGTSGTVNDVLAPYNKDALRQGDFSILSDRLYSVGATSPAPARQRLLNLRNKKVVFEHAATASDNSIYILAVSDDLTGTITDRIYLQWNAMLNYTDA